MDLRPSKIVVTGGAGFLGRHVVARLRRAGCRHVVVPRSARCDLTRREHVHALLVCERPDVVIHLAGKIGGIEANRRQPGTFAFQNLMMGAQLIEESRLAGVKKFLLAGTICSYPRCTPVPFKEADLWNGYPEETNAAYGLAKKMLMVQLHAYQQEFGFNGVNLLIVNLYGPGDHFDPQNSHVIPALIRKCIEANEREAPAIDVWGTGRASREFLYVEDAARAIHLAAEHLEVAEPINIGTGREIAIAELAQLVARKTGFRGEIRFDPTHPDGQPRRCLDVTRARRLLGFTPTVTLEEGIERTVEWYLLERKAKKGSRRAPAAQPAGK